MQCETRSITATSQIDETFQSMVEISGSTKNNIIPPSGANFIAKVDISVANPTAGDFVSFLKISGTGFAEQVLAGPSQSGVTSGAVSTEKSIPLGSGFPMAGVTDLNLDYAQASGGNLTQSIVATLFFE